MAPQIIAANPEYAEAASELVRASFNHFVAPDWEPQAREVFYVESSPEKIRLAIPTATYAALAQVNHALSGFILMPRPSLLAMLFVRVQNIGQGIGALLWEAAKAHLDANYPETKTVELNSSPYAVPAYRAMGFYPISEPFRRRGCLATLFGNRGWYATFEDVTRIPIPLSPHGVSHERRHCHSTKRQYPPFLALRSSGVPIMKTKTTTEAVQ